jgi:hypothetical protein
VTTTHYGPVLLNPNTHYELSVSFNQDYSGVNPDGIHYVIDADSEQTRSFRTRAE